MTPEQQFQFDLQGFLVIPGVLSTQECSALSDAADAAWPRGASDGPFRRTADVSRWSRAFQDLMDHPTVLPYLVELLGARLRIDHDYRIFMQRGSPAARLEHPGPAVATGRRGTFPVPLPDAHRGRPVSCRRPCHGQT